MANSARRLDDLARETRELLPVGLTASVEGATISLVEDPSCRFRGKLLTFTTSAVSFSALTIWLLVVGPRNVRHAAGEYDGAWATLNSVLLVLIAAAGLLVVGGASVFLWWVVWVGWRSGPRTLAEVNFAERSVRGEFRRPEETGFEIIHTI